MRSSLSSSFMALVAFTAPFTTAILQGKLVPPPLEITHAHIQSLAIAAGADAAVPVTGTSTFQQLIDHNHPELGTFSQQYWWSSQYWKGEGSPVVLFTPGEAAAAPYTGYLTNKTLTGLYAEAIEGAVVMIEHRYWGNSSPFDQLTTKNMQYQTLENAIADLTYFANNVVLSFDTNNSSQATRAPWVLSGGSYSGALAAWTESTAPGTFWAYHASSAPVEAISDYWQYFAPVQQGMPQNCSRDVTRVIDHVDNILTIGTDAEKQALKEMFGLGAIKHDDDFASALQNGPWLWQSNTFTTGYSGFYQFCDSVEGVFGTNATTVPGPSGVGLTAALQGYATWMKTQLIPGYCAGLGYWSDPMETACFDTYNASSPIYTDVSVGNAIDRAWQWFLCNQPLGYWQDGAPKNRPSIVSRLVTAQYWERQCGLYFPPSPDGFTYGRGGKTAHDVNGGTKGWKLTNTTRLIWTNGQFDPWKTSGVSSEYRPGGPLQSTPQAPVQVIPGGFHCSDLLARNGKANAGVQMVIDNEVAQIKAWVAEYYQK